MIVLLATLALGSEAPPPAIPLVASDADWSVARRYAIESEVHLPQPIVLAADNNKSARVLGWQLRLVLDCAPGTRETRHVTEVDCQVADVGLLAAAYAPDRGRLGEILPELHEKLANAVVQLQVRDDGRLINVGLDEVARDRLRMGRISENLRLVVSRAVAGLDLPVPTGERQWVQYSGFLLMLPSAIGSPGGVEMVHQLSAVRPDGWAAIASVGRGTAVLPTDDARLENAWSIRMSSTSGWDTTDHALASRRWIVVGDPTPGSAISEGFAGQPYLQAGVLTRLSPGASFDVGPTSEVTLPGLPDDGNLPSWHVLGAL
jgi:hypothetical protein